MHTLSSRSQRLSNSARFCDSPYKPYQAPTLVTMPPALKVKQGGVRKDPCWAGYRMAGTKIKDGKPCPNCIPVAKGGGGKNLVKK